MQGFNWDDIRFFLAVCREGSLSGAGKVLGVNHTTVLRRINALEHHLNTRLFDRDADGYGMSQTAEQMFRLAEDMEQRAQAIDREVFGRDAELSGPLTLTTPYDFANRVLVPHLARFKQEYPLIDLDILGTTGLMDLAAREADIAVRMTPKPPDYLVGREVMPLRHGIYGAPRYLKMRKAQPRVILFRDSDEGNEWIAKNFPRATVAMRTDDVTTMLEAVAQGLGMARMPCYIGDSDKRLRRLDINLVPSTWGVWVLSHIDLRSTARVRVCREFLFDAIEKMRRLILGENSRYYDG